MVWLDKAIVFPNKNVSHEIINACLKFLREHGIYGKQCKGGHGLKNVGPMFYTYDAMFFITDGSTTVSDTIASRYNFATEAGMPVYMLYHRKFDNTVHIYDYKITSGNKLEFGSNHTKNVMAYYKRNVELWRTKYEGDMKIKKEPVDLDYGISLDTRAINKMHAEKKEFQKNVQVAMNYFNTSSPLVIEDTVESHRPTRRSKKFPGNRGIWQQMRESPITVWKRYSKRNTRRSKFELKQFNTAWGYGVVTGHITGCDDYSVKNDSSKNIRCSTFVQDELGQWPQPSSELSDQDRLRIIAIKRNMNVRDKP